MKTDMNDWERHLEDLIEKELKPVRQAQEEIVVKRKELLDITTRITNIEHRVDESNNKLADLQKDKTARITSAALQDKVVNLSDLRQTERNLTDNIGDLSVALDILRTEKEGIERTIADLTNAVIPAWRQAWERVANSLEGELRDENREKFMSLFAAKRMSGSPANVEHIIIKALFPNGIFIEDLHNIDGAFRAKYQIV